MASIFKSFKKSNFKTLLRIIYSIVIFVGISYNAELLAQTWPGDTIHVNINSGNPAFPFPQFLEYKAGKSLAANNAVGVTHADMEKAMREGYQIMMHRALKVPGKVLNGKQYIVYNNNTVPSNWNTFVSEGDGYALLAAAYFGDKETFDGLWLWVHDNRMNKVKKYYDCSDLRPTYRYSPGLAGWKSDESTSAYDENPNNSAADGDVDIALALVMAYKQWGPLMGIKDACLNDISYRQEALKMVGALVDTFRLNNMSNAYTGHMSGVVGVDGYLKGGNTWDEITQWRYGAANTTYPWAKPKPEAYSNTNLFTDYNAPAYFNEFAKFLTANGGTPWQISQCLRAEASADWIIQQLNSKGLLPISCNGSISDNGATTVFSNFNSGEDFRLAWRTLLNYVWHDNPATKWDPVTHAVVAGANTHEYDMAVKYAGFLKVPKINATSATPYCSVLGASPDPSCPEFKGVVQLTQGLTVDGGCCTAAATRKTLTNYVPGTSVGAAVATGDLDLTAELYRQNEILWDDATYKQNGLTDDERYIKSTPAYFHDWFRILGMLTGSGNLHAPADMVAAANVKVYMAVDKTFAYEGDLITYTVSYRNYGSVAATGVTVVTTLDSDYQFVSASNGGANAGSTISWNIGSVPGFKTTAGINPTRDSMTFVVKVKSNPVHPRVCLTSTITASNSLPWTSNEYPNNASYTMERNCVDLLKDRILEIKKTTDRTIMNPGDIVNFTLDFENKTGSNLWLNGGRDRVTVSYANFHPTNGTSFYQFYRIWHTGHEAYINLGNYRISYFMNDAAAIGKYNAATNPTGWDTYVDNQSDLNKYGYNPLTLPADKQLKFTYQKIPWGSDASGSWNQRVVTQFASVLTAPSSHIYDKLDGMAYIHKGVVGPGFTRTRFESKPSSDLTGRLTDDWSFSTSVANTSLDGQAQRFFPISPTYTNALTNFAPVVINNYSKDICNPDVPNYERVLVEEFDGYTWRRIAGLGPLPGRETYNVVVTDSIPVELAWSAFTDDDAVGIKATYTALPGNAKFSGYVKWTIPVMLTGEKADLSYKTIAKSPCAEKNFVNAGWIWSDVDSPDSSLVTLKLTCNAVPPTPPKETSLVKTANTANAVVGDVINYTLTFTNEDGSTAAWNNTATLASDWQVIGTGTTMPDINLASISLDNNKNVTDAGAQGYAFGHKKSHGKNGYTDITFTTYDKGTFSLFYRNTAGTPGQANFKGVRLEIIPGNPNVIGFRVYNDNTLLATSTNVAYPGSYTSIKLRTQLLDDKLYIWANDFTGAPLKVISGITNLDAGYAGIYSASSTEQNITAYTTHWDSAFDLVISDPVPAQLNNITNLVPDNGVLTGSTITWPTVPGPILANAVIERTFDATVNTCADFITNIGKASVYGVSNIQSQYVITCGATAPPCTPPAIPVITAAQTICTGTAPAQIGGTALTGGPATGAASYIWERSPNGTAGWTTVTGATGKDYTPGSLTADAYYRRIDSKGNCTSLPSNVIKITVTPLTVAGTIAADQTICSGSVPAALTGTASTGGVTVKNYKWQRSATGIAPWTQVAAYSSTATGFAPGALTADTYYRRIDSSGACPGIAADTIKITVTAAVTAGTISLAQTICSGTVPAALTGTVSTGGVTVKNYKWQRSATGIAPWTQVAAYSSTATGFIPGSLTATTYYRRIDSSGVCLGIPTNTIIITVDPVVTAPAITAAQAICTGGTPALIGGAAAAGGSATAAASYLWESSADGTTGWATVSGATLKDYTPGTLTATTYYRRTDRKGACPAAVSNVIQITVDPAVTAAVITADQSVCSGEIPAQIGGPVASGGSSTATATYVWESSTTSATAGFSAISGASLKEYTPGALAVDTWYRRIDKKGQCVNVESNAVKISIVANAPATVALTQSPTGTICAGTSVTFTASPGNGGTAPAYEWFIKETTDAAPVSQGAASSAAGADKFTRTTLTNGDEVSVRMVSNSGCVIAPGVASSNVITMTVTPIPVPSVSLSADKSTVCPSETIIYTAVPIAGGSAPAYVWKNNGTVLTGQSGSTYTTTGTALGSPNSVTVEMVSNAACALSTAAVSNPVVITIKPTPAPAVTIVSDITNVCEGNPVTFTATPTDGGAAPIYEWFIGTASQQTGLSITFTTSDLTIPPALPGNVVTVKMVSNAACAGAAPAASNPVMITVNPGVKPGNLSSGQVICYNTNPFKISEVNAGNAAAATYTWEKTPDENDPLSWVTAVGASSNGGKDFTPTELLISEMFYRRRVDDAAAPSLCSYAYTTPVKITVNPEVTAGTIDGDETICENEVASMITSTSLPTGGSTTSIPNFEYIWQTSAYPNGPFSLLSEPVTDGTYNPGSLTNTTYFRRGAVNTCATIYSNIITKTVTPETIVSVTIDDPLQTCSGTQITITATPAGEGSTPTYSWMKGGISVGTNSPTYTFTPVLADNGKKITVTLKSSETCNTGDDISNAVTLDIAGTALPAVTITGSPLVQCAGLPVKFTVSSTTAGGSNPSYQWFVQNAAGVSTAVAGATNTNFTSLDLNPGDKVYVELSSNLVCALGSNPHKSNVIAVTILPAPAPVINETPVPVCTPDGFPFTATVGSGTPPTTLQWYKDGIAISGATQSGYTAYESGSYSVEETNEACGTISTEVALTVIQRPEANAGSDVTVKEGDEVILNGSGGAVYSWTPDTGLDDVHSSNPKLTADKTITYVLTVTDATGQCSDDAEVTVFVERPIRVPNVITVNGDGVNDTWEIENIESFPNAEFLIYNRWGNLVWKSTGYPKEWDATNFRNGEVLPDGTYFYIIDLHSTIYTEAYTGYIQVVK